ncbi:MAG: hypothetical protein HC786_24745 [Richelia sp. CSU_2_1]|nr:hypothetical protein [Microcoleus sp. SU_5_6]NJL66087.1 hypothetical protein [Microcoleus sp. SM1_3_4]NJR25134.1 hypothetical protein [Richelia sp. CSU_2_1]
MIETRYISQLGEGFTSLDPTYKIVVGLIISLMGLTLLGVVKLPLPGVNVIPSQLSDLGVSL